MNLDYTDTQLKSLITKIIVNCSKFINRPDYIKLMAIVIYNAVMLFFSVLQILIICLKRTNFYLYA